MRERLKSRLEISPRALRAGDAGRACRPLADRAHRRRRAPDRLGLGCPDWPKCYGGTTPPLESHAVIEYTNRLITGIVGFAVIAASPARLVPAALPLAPGAVRGAAAARGDRPGDPRGAGGQVPPRARAGDEPLHPLDDAARRRLRPGLVLALRTLGAAALPGPARRLGGAGADPAGAADDPRRHDRHGLRAPRRRPRRPAGPPLRLRGREDAGMGGRAARRHRHRLRPRRDRRSGSSSGAPAATGGR